MDISGVIQLIASSAEAFVALTAVRIAVQKKKAYGWFIALTFTLFVLFNCTRIFSLAVPEELDALVFLAAGASMLWAMLLIRKDP
ncbi:hypothetical protein [Methanoregula formicica]|uniref:Uncharacterized protein n=1 Tax=Methanoregula formicica (strain DSM 22288 / NBRC 105244 / SMSP) TaxID=593750 RepID=L0HAB4_METFS|nr:hypothetical protein [Methanoregula formicica]AGB01657.1 hypothetical protein Metfor_0596 [Methanoregula formicica SMSP]